MAFWRLIVLEAEKMKSLLVFSFNLLLLFVVYPMGDLHGLFEAKTTPFMDTLLISNQTKFKENRDFRRF